VALEAGINFRYIDDRTVGISLNETVTTDDVQDVVNVFAKALGKVARPNRAERGRIPDSGVRVPPYIHLHDAPRVQYASV
jgi:hypothetical protein